MSRIDRIEEEVIIEFCASQEKAAISYLTHRLGDEYGKMYSGGDGTFWAEKLNNRVIYVQNITCSAFRVICCVEGS